ncbi:MAG TPA: SpoIIE family protein phosphatase [Verrucomicrobiae bacterium]|nr:SpoIIE family protein phosphatase [Verrucomicrobiae bacterium]
MDSEPLKVLQVVNDEAFSRTVADAIREIGGTAQVVTFDTAVATLKNNSYSAVLFEPPTTNAAGLFQITSLAVQSPKVPVIVIGSTTNEPFAVEAITAGAQDFIAKEEFTVRRLERKILCAIERHLERVSLVQEKENYYSIFDHLVEGIFRTTPDGHYLLANVALAKIYGYDTPTELMGRITDIARSLYVDPNRRDEFVRLMQGHDTLTAFESKIYRKDGTIIWISENCHAIRDEQGKLLYYEGTVEDITERKRAEEQIRRATGELSRSREELRTQNEVMQENLRMAKEIQMTMLPQVYPSFPRDVVHEQSAFQFTHRYQPAEDVSGDFFNVIALSDTEANVLICDVTGHGIRAALVTAMIRALSEELKTLAHEPGMFLRKLNSDLCSILKTTGSPMLTTAFHLIANAETGLVRFANAGHPKPLLVRRSDSTVQPLINSTGHSQPALGLFDDPPYQTTELQLQPGDLLMLFTDGLYEVQGSNEELYSQQRMVLDIKNLIQKPTSQLFDDLLEGVRAFAVSHEFEDDVCIVGMDFVKQLTR